MTGVSPGATDKKRKRKRVDASFIVLGVLVLVALVIAARQDPALPLAGLSSGWRLLVQVGPALVMGFLLAGFLDVLVPPEKWVAWLGGDQNLGRSILLGWGVGLIVPGGPYVLFPVVAKLYQLGVAPGAIITLITAQTLLSPIRLLTYEAPLLGWPMTLARLIPILLLPPLVGFVGHWLHEIFRR